jgi:hypothetical protein
MDRAQELEHLRQAERHIDEAKALIETQREFVRELTQKGQDPEVANSGLRAMERTLKAFERHRDVTRSLRRMCRVRAALRCQATSARMKRPACSSISDVP